MRTVLVVAHGEREERFAVPFRDEQAAFPRYKQELLTAVLRYYYDADDEEFQQLATAIDGSELGEWSEVLLLEEGEQGVWVGYSSADRAAVGGPAPAQPGEFMGNGDPEFYLTAGVPEGQEVPSSGYRPELDVRRRSHD